MTALYECAVDGCDWRNPDWRYGFADAGATWASHMSRVHKPPVYGMCTACGAIEVALNAATGTRDFSSIGESAEYPTGHGCEVCA
jgi:hypothetical protein